MRSRSETNFVRLLEQCKSMANSGRHTEWRFEKFIGTLEEQLKELRTGPLPPEKDILDEYTRTLLFLRGLIITEKLPSATEKVVAAQFLSPCSSPYGDAVSKEIKHKIAAQYSNEVRDELLSNQSLKIQPNEALGEKIQESDSLYSSVRQRKGESQRAAKANVPDRDFDAVMKHEQKTQEEITETMLYLSRSMKEQATITSSIIRQDIKTLQESNSLAEENQSNLQVHSQKLRERSGFCARCWIWLCIFLVCMAFVAMVIFMRLFKKKKSV